MITKDNLEDLLQYLDFEQQGTVYSKYFDAYDAYLKVDFTSKQLIYPEEKGLKINERQTCNFSDNENFVVFECVHRLLEKGYKPEHIELEPKWKVGHGASGGRADVLVNDNAGKSLLIIECKTAGKQFKDAWNVTQQNGGQLLSYVQQQRSTQFVCLYASTIESGRVAYQNYIVALKDNEKLLDEYEGRQPLTFRDAQDVEAIYKAWKETYKLDFATKGIFEDDIQPYHIGKQKFTVSDLTTISHHDIQGKYHEFATILRQHNVSGRENAFDKLVNLFLCKIVDETKNPNDLKFYWKGIAYDSFFDLQDRLQQLYQAGMQESLKEDVTYIDNAAIDNAFRFFKNDPDATRDTIKKYFRQLKFFTNNDFAFIDVHNEKLFYQNAEVLLKIVRMLQDIRLQSDEQNQFLGDMFEGFLDQGVKQSEGQFFTPTPIVKFIMSALPLEELVQTSEQPPRAIDYACGAGHFLNELALQLKPFVETHKKADPKEYYKAIQGIEKEYRLSKVAKVSAAMYGQNEISIVYADALARHEQVNEGSYSILVANPPYSVKGFLETLPDTDRKLYQLYGDIDTKTLARNNAIETFFIERAKQLLQPAGVAAIIVPSSILSNAKGGYVATRAILLQYFDIVAIAQFGSRTFGKTGTNTVTLFLRRKAENPAPAEHFQNRVNAWFRGNDDKDAVFADEHYIRDYCAHINVAFDAYKTLLLGEPNAELLAHELFVDYERDFESRTETKNFRKQRDFKALDADAQQVAINARLLTYLRRVEKDKLYYYVLATDNPQPVVIIKSPTKTKAQKQFLGYDWSGTKGSEGIKYLTTGSSLKDEAEDDEDVEQDVDIEERIIENLNSLQYIQTPLYDPKSLANPEKLNTVIRQNFLKQPLTIAETLQPFVSTARLVDMLDFSRVDFEKQFSLTPKKNTSINTVWPVLKLGEVCVFEYGKSLPEGKRLDGRYPVIGSNGRVGFHNEYVVEGPAIIIGRKGSAGVIFWESENCYPIDTTFYIVTKTNQISISYLYLVLLKAGLQELSGGTGVPGLNRNDAYEVRIPLPPTDIQAHIVAECEAVDAEAAAAKQAIGEAKQTIEELIQDEFSKGYPEKQLRTVALINPSKTEIKAVDENTLVSFVEMASVSNDGFIEHKEDRPLKDLKKGSYTYFRENDIILAKITPCMENGKSALAQGLTNGLAMGSSELHVIRTNDDVTPKYTFTLLNRETVRNEAEPNMTGSSGHRRVPASFYENYRIPVPPLAQQAELVVAVGLLEARITAAQAVLDGAANRKQAIIQRYLTDQTLVQSQQRQPTLTSSADLVDNEPVISIND